VGLGEGWLHGNVVHALGTLGGQTVSCWHGRVALHGRPQAELARGIDPVGHCGFGGEVTTQGVVGDVLSELDAHGGRGSALGEHGVGRAASLWGGVEQGGQQGRRSPIGGWRWWRWLSRRERGEGSGRVCPRAPPLPLDSNQI
jgi:hypothetical protein